MISILYSAKLIYKTSDLYLIIHYIFTLESLMGQLYIYLIYIYGNKLTMNKTVCVQIKHFKRFFENIQTKVKYTRLT